jgi:hypothetical protein
VVRTPAPTAQRPADFVQAFLALLSGPTTKTSGDAADIASMYAPSVRYFGKGVWTRAQIADDRRRPLSQYDYTSYALDGPVHVRAGDGSEVIVDFRGNYEVHKTRGDEVLCGVFEDRMVLVDVGGRWLIAAHEEDVLDRRRGGDCR